MSYRKRIYTNEFPYHITCRSNNQEWFAVDDRTCWNVFALNINKAIKDYRLDVHAFVLMSNHYHLLASTDPGYDLGLVMNRFQTETGRDINGISGRRNHVFGKRYSASLITNPYYYFNALKYIYRNPVRANICTRPDVYSFSTFGDLANQIQFKENDKYRNSYFFKTEDDFKKWVLMPSPNESDLMIKKGLKRTEFYAGTSRRYSKFSLKNNLY